MAQPHQPIEQLEHLRVIPNLNVFRPADINETLECWEIAKSKNNPSAIALSRQKLPYVCENSSVKICVLKVAMLKKTSDQPQVSIIASGSEVEIALKLKKLKDDNIESQLTSVPSYDIFQGQRIYTKTKCLEKIHLKYQ